MKTTNKIAISICLLASLTIAATIPRRQHEVVILKAYDQSYSLQTGAGNCGNGTAYRGMRVYNASCSADAPQYDLPTFWSDCAPPGYTNTPINFAEEIARNLEDGFRIDWTSMDGMTVRMVK